MKPYVESVCMYPQKIKTVFTVRVIELTDIQMDRQTKLLSHKMLSLMEGHVL